MNFAARIAAVWALGALLGPALADDKDLQQAIQGAAQDLGNSEWRKAQHELEKARRDFAESKDASLRAQYTFYSGLVDHQCSDDRKVAAADRESARLRGIAAYETYLQSNPDSGGALNNLAQLYAQGDADQRKKALGLYERAAAVKDPRATTYELNRIKLLGDMGATDQALRETRKVSAARVADSDAALELELSLLRRLGPADGIANYVRRLNGLGRVNSAIDTSLAEFDRRTSSREPILVALAETFANPVLTDLPERFIKTEAAQRLSKHANDGDIGAGVSQLLMLFDQKITPNGMTWWRQDFNPYDEQRTGSRSAAALTLARALGDRCRLAGRDHYPCAETYYRFAIDFTNATADPQAFLALAQILASTGRQEELAGVAKRYEAALFNGKETAYGRESKPRIFQFHMALGTMYAYIGKWEDPQRPWAGAVFQLQHARDVAKEYNAGSSANGHLDFPEQAAELLSTGYERTGKIDESARVRVEAAEEYLAVGDKASAATLLDKDWRASLPAKTDVGLVRRASELGARAGVKYD